MPICLFGVLGHIRKPNYSLAHSSPLHIPNSSSDLSQVILEDVNGISRVLCEWAPLRDTQHRPFYPSLGPAVCGSSPPSLARPKTGNLLLAPSKSAASTPALPEHCRVPAPANITTRLPVPHVKDWHLSRGQLCLMSWVLLSVLNSLSLVLTKAAGIVSCCCEIFWHACCWCFGFSVVQSC